MGKVINNLLDLIYPPACPICQSLLKKGESCCRDCSITISYVSQPTCLRCGCEIDSEDKPYCEDCTDHERSFVCGFPAVNYTGGIRDCLAGFKYGGKKYYGDFLADLIVKRQGNRIKNLNVDVLVPVPVHKNKLKKRGYNQAKILADKLGEKLRIPVDDKILVRSVNTEAQKQLDAIQREINLKKAFNSAETIVKYKKAMLIDDIYTTGATIEACTRVLKDIGVETVYYASVCVGKGY